MRGDPFLKERGKTMAEKKGQESGLEKAGRIFTNLYCAIGAVSMGILAFMTIFTVIMRYFFSLNWKQVAEFNVTLFAFTTFWGLGYCILKNEHVMIDALYDILPVKVKRILSIVDYVIVLVVLGVFVKYGIAYVKMAGVQLSLGMEIPMYYMYGIMPVTGVLCAVCVVIKMIETVKAPDSAFARQSAKLREGEK